MLNIMFNMLAMIFFTSLDKILWFVNIGRSNTRAKLNKLLEVMKNPNARTR